MGLCEELGWVGEVTSMGCSFLYNFSFWEGIVGLLLELIPRSAGAAKSSRFDVLGRMAEIWGSGIVTFDGNLGSQ